MDATGGDLVKQLMENEAREKIELRKENAELKEENLFLKFEINRLKGNVNQEFNPDHIGTL